MSKITRRNFLLYSGIGSASFLSRKRWPGSIWLNNREKDPPSFAYDPWIELNIDSLTWNLKRIKEAAEVAVMAVIKANAYGHGLEETAKYLEKAGIDYLMVGKLQEALLLREKGISVPILNFGPFHGEDAEVITRQNISQSVFDEKASYLNEVALKLAKRAKVHIHLDTGMGRMGISYRQALPYIEKLSGMKGLLIEGVSTTLTEDDDFDLEQLQRFRSLYQKAEKKGFSLGLKHAASSDASSTFPHPISIW